MPTARPTQHNAPAQQESAEEVLAKRLERELDAALEATFPASDPIAISSVEVRKTRRRLFHEDADPEGR